MFEEIAILVSLIISSLHYLPFQHWFFRNLDFAKIQLTVLQVLLLIVILVRIPYLSHTVLYSAFLLGLICLHNISILLPYTIWYPSESKKIESSKKPVRFLAVNVYQYNTQKHLLIDLVKTLKPDLLLTMESDHDWEKALEGVEDLFKHSVKVPQDNTYGIHFYTSLKAEDIKVNYQIANDIPSVEARLKTEDDQEFIFYGIHPPPPSPTEEKTSKERDADILALSRKIKKHDLPCIVVGDFNNVAWSKSSKLFKKSTQLIDPRIGRGFISTFHANYMFFRFPIDLVFHSPSIYIQKLRTEKHINSDHFPLYGEFILQTKLKTQVSTAEEIDKVEQKRIDEMIDEGKKMDSANRENA